MLANKPIETLDRIAAYHSGKPIRNAKEVERVLETTPMSAEWKEAIRSKFWALNPLEGIPEPLKPVLTLRDKLLTFGGEEACMPAIEEDLDKILIRGQFWHGDRTNMHIGQSSRCHENSVRLWDSNPDDLVIATGYALSKDGMWRQHSWCIHVRPGHNDIVETTVERVAYFGFVMNEEESRHFEYWCS